MIPNYVSLKPDKPLNAVYSMTGYLWMEHLHKCNVVSIEKNVMLYSLLSIVLYLTL